MITSSEEKTCKTCDHYLGGGCCAINEEDECEAGGGYELWKKREEMKCTKVSL
jgi:hypothetical protein